MTTATIILQPLKSSMFTAAGYDADSFTLLLQYKNGDVWQYESIGEEMADDFYRAESQGKFFLSNIADNPEHPATRVQSPAPELSGGEQAELHREAEDLHPPALDEDELKLEALAVETKIRALTIATPAQYEQAAEALIRVRQNKKTAQDRVNQIKSPAYATYKAALDLEKQVLGPYTQAENYLAGNMADYRAAEKAQRAADERRLTEERRLANEAEAQRKAAADRETEAKAADARGNTQAAAIVRQAPLQFTTPRVQSVVLPTSVPKVKGIIERNPVWRWRIKPGEEHLIPRQYLQINEVAINAAVRSQKQLTDIPGLEVYSEEANPQVRAQ